MSLLVCTGLLVGCGTENEEKVDTVPAAAPVEEEKSEEENKEEIVTVENYNRTLVFEDVPERVISTNEHTTEILLSLGLEDKIIGVVQRDGREILPSLQEAFRTLQIIGNNNPSLEVMLDLAPDFIYGRESTFSGNNVVASVEEFANFNIQTYVDTDSYQEGTTMEEVYQDIINLGKIFRVEERAMELVNEMKAKAEQIEQQISDVSSPVRVLVFDQGGDEVFTAGNGSLQTTLIEMAGGENVFSDIEKTWARVSWEEVVDRDPEIIVINNYGTTSAEEKINELKGKAHMQDVDAIKNERFVIIDLDSVFAGIRNIDAVEVLAKGFYPEKFE